MFVCLIHPIKAQFQQNADDPEIFTCVFNYEIEKSREEVGQYLLGYRIQMLPVAPFYLREQDGSFSLVGDTSDERWPDESEYTFPTTATIPPIGLPDPNDWLTQNWPNQNTIKQWYGFEIHTADLTPYPNFAFGIYKLKVDVIFDNGTQDFYRTLGYIYIDCRDVNLYNYGPLNPIGHKIDIAIKYSIPQLDITGYPFNPDSSYFKIKNIGVEENWKIIKSGETIRYWEIKEVSGPTMGYGMVYLPSELTINFHNTAPLNANPSFQWSHAPSASFYHVYRYWEENGILHSPAYVAITYNNYWTDNSVIIRRNSNDKYIYKIHSSIQNFSGNYLSAPSEFIVISGDGPIYKNTANSLDGNFIELGVYPNPFNSLTNVIFSVLNEDHLVINLLDITGKKIREITNSKNAPGNYTLPINFLNLSSGVYLIQIIGDKSSDCIKVLFLK